MGKLKSRLLPRKTLKVKKIYREMDEYNYPMEGEKIEYIYDCTVHPAKSSEIGLSEEGFRNKKCFKIISREGVEALKEGDKRYYLIEAVPDVWCSIVEDQVWENQVKNHTVLFVVERNER